MLAKLLTVAVLALLCIGALVVTGASYADHSGARPAVVTVQQR